MAPEKFTTFLQSLGWEQDKWGHLHKEVMLFKSGAPAPRNYRIKMQAISCRIEVQCIISATDYSSEQRMWVRVGGGYFKDIIELPDGRIRVGGQFFGKAKEQAK